MRLIIAETLNQTPVGQRRVELVERKEVEMSLLQSWHSSRLFQTASRADNLRFSMASYIG